MAGSEEVQWEEIKIVIKNKWFGAKRWGPADSENKWIAFHGWMDNAATFDLLVPKLIAGITPQPEFVCIDLAGHGKSYHRSEGNYNIPDYVADTLQVIEALQWDKFSILAHSLGQSVGCVLAGTVPDRVNKLILLEGLGSATESEEDVPRLFAKAVKDEMAFNKEKNFYTFQEAIERRVRGNVVSYISREGAEILALRGLSTIVTPVLNLEDPSYSLVNQHSFYSVYKQIAGTNQSFDKDGKYAWSSDSKLLLPTRIKFTEGILLAFIRNISCPVLIILTKDGLFTSKQFKTAWLFSFFGRSLLNTLYYSLFLVSSLPLVGRYTNRAFKAVRMGYQLSQRFTKFRKGTKVLLNSGGHHPQLVVPVVDEIASSIVDWYKKY